MPGPCQATGVNPDQGKPGYHDWLRDVHMTQARPIRILQGLAFWSCFFSGALVPQRSKLPAVLFLDTQKKISGYVNGANIWREWPERGRKEASKPLLRLLISSGCSCGPPESPPSQCAMKCPLLFSKASVSWFPSHGTQRLVTSAMP